MNNMPLCFAWSARWALSNATAADSVLALAMDVVLMEFSIVPGRFKMHGTMSQRLITPEQN
eukprot:3766345-Amphidinium_carterae.1